MTRLLFWIVLFALAYWLWRKATRAQREPRRTEEKTLPMVRCAQCGVHVPRSDALQAQDRWYCSQAHLQQDQATRGQ